MNFNHRMPKNILIKIERGNFDEFESKSKYSDVYLGADDHRVWWA